MKKQVLLLLVISLIFTFSSANAQSRNFKKTQAELCPTSNAKPRNFKKSQPKFGAGVKAGLNYSSQYAVNKANNVDFKSILGINAGAYCNYFLFDFLAIQPELLISGKGTQWKNQFYDARYNLTYIDFPLLIKFQPVRQFNIHAGPQLSYLIIARQTDLVNNQKTNVMKYFYKLDLGLAVGVEANLPLNLNLAVRYILGLNTATTGAPYTELWKNKSFQISLGYRLLGR